MKKWKKIILRTLLVLFAMLLTAGIVIGIKYVRVSNANIQPELLNAPQVPAQENLVLGKKFHVMMEFRLPWGAYPRSITIQPPEGIQLTAEPYFKRKSWEWGSSLWNAVIPMQGFREGIIKNTEGNLSFSNGGNISFQIPSFKIQPLEVKGTELTLAGKWEEEKSTGNRTKIIVITLLAILILLCVAALLWLKHLQHAKQKILPPWTTALEAIRRLTGKVRTGDALPENSIARLTDIVREYMEQRFHLRAGRQTTAEFMQDLEKGKGELSEKNLDFLRSFLNAADMVKFAKLSADRMLFENAATKAEELIIETTPVEGKENKK